MSDPSDLSWWFGNQGSTNLDPNAAKMGDAGYQRGYIQQALGSLGQRQAPQIGQLQTGQYNQWAAQQQNLANQLGQVASGSAPGAGELAVNRQIQQGLAAQASAANSARGANAMLAGRSAARGAGDLAVNGAGLAQQAALQDQQNARSLQANVLGQGAGQALNVAQMQQQGSISNMQAQLQQMGMNDQQALGMLSAMTGIDQSELQARMQQEQMSIGQQQPGMLGPLLQAGAGIAGAAIMSDERLKTDVRDGADDADALMEALRPYSYRYRDEARHGRGARLGVMAQDMERSALGRGAVREEPDGLALDVNRAVSAALASVARLHERVRDLEGRG